MHLFRLLERRLRLAKKRYIGHLLCNPDAPLISLAATLDAFHAPHNKNTLLQPYAEPFSLTPLMHCLVDKSTRILDFGCNAGEQLRLVADAYPDKQYVGLDLSPKRIAAARDLSSKHGDSLEFICANVFETDEWRREPYDLIYVRGVFPVLDRPSKQRMIQLLQNALRDDGVLIFDDFNTNAMFYSLVTKFPNDAKNRMVDHFSRQLDFLKGYLEVGLEKPYGGYHFVDETYYNAYFKNNNVKEYVTFTRCNDFFQHMSPTMHHFRHNEVVMIMPTAYHDVLTSAVETLGPPVASSMALSTGANQ